MSRQPTQPGSLITPAVARDERNEVVALFRNSDGVPLDSHSGYGDHACSVMNLNFTGQTSARNEGYAIDDIRALVAAHLEVDVSRIRDEAHLTNDLGADWLDRLELRILLEDHFAGVEIADADADEIEFVGDVIRYIEARIVGKGSTGSIGFSENAKTAPPVRARRCVVIAGKF